MIEKSSLHDQPNSFGWISIALHWTTAVAVVALWFVGKSILWVPTEEIDQRRALHITIGLIAWLPLAARIVWRFRNKHPQATGQSLKEHHVARFAHMLMLVLLTLMILSGPLMAWLLPERTALTNLAFAIHSNAANVLLVLILLHVAGALKHLMFDDDETIARIFVPRKTMAKPQLEEKN